MPWRLGSGRMILYDDVGGGALPSFADMTREWQIDVDSVWEAIGDDYVLRPEEEFEKTDPITFDDAMGFAPPNDSSLAVEK